jgi:hypothetical protein
MARAVFVKDDHPFAEGALLQAVGQGLQFLIGQASKKGNVSERGYPRHSNPSRLDLGVSQLRARDKLCDNLAEIVNKD